MADELSSLRGFLARQQPGLLLDDAYDPQSHSLTVDRLTLTAAAVQDPDWSALSAVVRLRGSLVLQGLPAHTDWSVFDGWQMISGALVIESCALSHLEAFAALVSVGGNLCLRDHAQLVRLDGFDALTQVQGALIIERSPQLDSIGAFARLRRLGGLQLARLALTHLCWLRGWLAVTPHVPGSIKITFCRLQDVAPLAGVEVIEGSLYLHNNQLSSLTGLECLTRVGGSFTLSYNRLTSVLPLSRLSQVGGLLALDHNRLTCLGGLASLVQLGTVRWGKQVKTLTLHGNPQLEDFRPLAGVQTPERYVVLLMDAVQTQGRWPAAGSPFHGNIRVVHDAATRQLLPLPAAVRKPVQDYAHFRLATHHPALNYLVDADSEADQLVLAFSCVNGKLGAMFHNRFALLTDQARVHQLFVKDPSHRWFQGGIEGLTGSMEETLSFLQRLLTLGNYRRLVCVGASMGGYMALLVGSVLGADRVLAFSPQTFLDEVNRQHYKEPRWADYLARLPTGVDPLWLDVRRVMDRYLQPDTRIDIHYGKQLYMDGIHVKHLGERPNVHVCAHEVCRHDISVYLDQQGVLNDLLAGLVRP